MSKKLLFNFNREVIQNYTYVKYVGTIITATNTLEKPIKSATLKGSTKYRDIDTGEVLDAFEDGRNLELVSVKTPVLMTTGKNLYNGYEKGGLNTSTGLVDTTKPNECSVNFIYIRGQKRLKTNLPARCIVLFYDINKEFVDTGWHEYSGSYPTINIPSGYDLHYMRIRIRPGEITEDFKKKDVMVVRENDDIVPYEPYKSNILTVNEEVDLRGIEDTKDTLDCSIGELIQRVKKIVLNDSLNWILNDPELENTVDFYVRVEDKKSLKYETTIPKVSWRTDSFGVVIDTYHHKNLAIRVEKSRLSSSTVEGFKEYIKQNPITILYELATESTKTVDLSILDQNENKVSSISSFNDTTHIKASSETIPPIFEGYLATKEVE